jgi:hypothetical protein
MAGNVMRVFLTIARETIAQEMITDVVVDVVVAEVGDN